MAFPIGKKDEIIFVMNHVTKSYYVGAIIQRVNSYEYKVDWGGYVTTEDFMDLYSLKHGLQRWPKYTTDVAIQHFKAVQASMAS